MAQVSGTLITRNYTNFRGVDFSNKEVNPVRSPKALNMWKNYKNSLGKCIETRPDIALLETFNNTVFGFFFYKVGNIQHKIIHSGTTLYDEVNGTKTVIYSGMNPKKSQSFIYNSIFYIKDGINYLEFNGTTCKPVEGYVPRTSISRKPEGGGTTLEDVNLISAYRRNSFVGDDESTVYHLDTKEIDNDFKPVVTIDGTILSDTGYTFDAHEGTVTFVVAPPKPLTTGYDNVEIKFKKQNIENMNKILKCNILEVFDNRVFFSGNENYPNTIFHSSLNDPRYCSDLDYYNEGLDEAPVKSMVAGNNALWVFKEPSQANTTVFYHNPVIDSSYGKIYPSVHSSISTGCVATGINFNDDIVFFSDRGMEAINGDVTTEQVVAHRSSLVDSKLLNEINYERMILTEYEGYLLVIIDNKVYLADSRATFLNETHNEYEWFYWELSKNITSATVYENTLYLGTEDGIYTLNGTNDIESYWTTPEDEFNYPQYQKTTNKRGCVVDSEGEEITISIKINKNPDYDEINTYKNVTGYLVSRIKKKKWKSIQMKFSSNKPFKLYSSTLESYVGAYLKR